MPEKSTYKNIRKTVGGLMADTGKAGGLYKNLFEDSHSVMLIIHPEDGAIIDANKAACSFYQYEKKSITDMAITDINTLPPKKTHEEMQNAKTEQRNFFNFKHRLSTKETRDVEVYSSPILIGEHKVLYSIIHDVTERLKLEIEREEGIIELKKAHDEIKMLRGFLPLCSFCKKIRIDDKYWVPVDVYIHRNSEASITHTICPQCREEHYPGLHRRKSK